MLRILKSLVLIINYKTIIITTLAIISSYVCFHMGFTAKFPDMLVGVAIVFPVVFSIGAAFNRRETALQRLSDFKGHGVAIFYATRDWTATKDNNLPERARGRHGERKQPGERRRVVPAGERAVPAPRVGRDGDDVPRAERDQRDQRRAARQLPAPVLQH